MASHVVDSEIFKDIFGSAAMRAVFSDEGLVRRWLQVEAALARAEAKLGVIPEWAAAEISRKAVPENIDLERLRAETELVGYPILPLVRQLAQACEGGAGEYIHWGATTQDIMDTAMVLQLKDALGLIRDGLVELEDRLATLAEAYRDTPMAGRTHGQQALPITFGYKVAVWLAETHRHLKRLAELEGRVLVGQLGGAVGTLAAVGERGLEIQRLFLKELGLGVPEIAWHVARDRVAEVVCFLGLLTATLGKIAQEIALLSRTELAEVREPFAAGRGASSTMPQKSNPIGAEAVIALTKVVRQQVPIALDAMVQDGERGTGPWLAEWECVPEAFILTAGALSQLNRILGGLEVDVNRMARNLGLSGGLIMAEAVVMALAPQLGRQRAHELVYAACRRAEAEGLSLVEVLRADPELTRHLEAGDLKRLLDPDGYVGVAGAFVDRVVGLVRKDREVIKL